MSRDDGLCVAALPPVDGFPRAAGVMACSCGACAPHPHRHAVLPRAAAPVPSPRPVVRWERTTDPRGWMVYLGAVYIGGVQCNGTDGSWSTWRKRHSLTGNFDGVWTTAAMVDEETAERALNDGLYAAGYDSRIPGRRCASCRGSGFLTLEGAAAPIDGPAKCGDCENGVAVHPSMAVCELCDDAPGVPCECSEVDPARCERDERLCHNCGRGLAHDEPCPPIEEIASPEGWRAFNAACGGQPWPECGCAAQHVTLAPDLRGPDRRCALDGGACHCDRSPEAIAACQRARGEAAAGPTVGHVVSFVVGLLVGRFGRAS